MSEKRPERMLLKSSTPVGIVGYGAYVPRYRLPAKEISRVWTGGVGGTPIQEKSVPGFFLPKPSPAGCGCCCWICPNILAVSMPI